MIFDHGDFDRTNHENASNIIIPYLKGDDDLMI